VSLNDPQSASAVLETAPEEVIEEPALEGQPSRMAGDPDAGRTAETSITEPLNAKLALRLQSIPDFDRHSRKCQICSHPDIDEIEDQFINWTTAEQIRKTFKIKGESTIYRHARATGLDICRRENLAVVLEKVLQEIDNVETPTVSEILRAARILARLNPRGQWLFPPIVTNDASSGHGFGRAEHAGNSGVSTPEGRLSADAIATVSNS